MEKISKNIDSIASEERFKRSLRNKVDYQGLKRPLHP